MTLRRRRHTDPELSSIRLLDVLLKRYNLKNDAELARWLNVGPPMISKIRTNSSQAGAAFILRVHEMTGWSAGEIRSIIRGSKGTHHPETQEPAPEEQAREADGYLLFDTTGEAIDFASKSNKPAGPEPTDGSRWEPVYRPLHYVKPSSEGLRQLRGKAELLGDAKVADGSTG